MPVESLRVAIGFSASLDLYDHSLSIKGMYEDWYNRVVPVQGFVLNDIPDVQRVITFAQMKNRLTGKKWTIEHTMVMSRDWHSDVIPLQSRFYIADTVTCTYRFMYARVAVWYHSEYQGIASDLPECILIHPMIGIQFDALTFFASIPNALNDSIEYYDGYWTRPRQIAGGIRFRKIF